LVGPGGRAIGFEPNPATLAKCRRNLSFNDYPNVELHAEALGRQPGTVAFGRPAPTNAGADRVMPTGPATIDVRVTTLDQLLEEKPVDRLDLVKIDVEGFDLNVLRGGERTIARYRPTVFVELSDSNLREQGDGAVGLVRWLEDRDYLVEDAVTRTPVRSTDELSGCFRDVIATPA
jgi:FkbM family methyltransferase